MGPQEQALYNLRDSAAGQDWRPLVTKENVEAALAALPPLRKPDRTGDENRGVRFYNLSDERLTCTILDAEGRESLGSMPGMSPFDRVQFIWDRGCGVMTSPSTVVRVQGNVASEDYFVNGDSNQHILVLQPAVEEGEAPMRQESGEEALAQLTAMGYDEMAATDALAHSNGDVQAAIAHLADAPHAAPGPPPAPEGPATLESWARLDRFQVRDRSYRMKMRLTALGGSVSQMATGSCTVKLADFEVIKQLGTGANAFAYLAKCRAGGQLDAHQDMMAVLKVIVKYKQAGGAELGAEIDRAFLENVKKEASGPAFPEFRDNIVHILGVFMDNADQLKEYRELDPDGEFVDVRTSFIVMPLFAGGDLEGLLKRCKEQGTNLEENTILDYTMQMLDAVVKLLKHGNTHRDLKADNIFFTGNKKDLALADFGELGPVQLEYKDGVSPGGASGNYAPEVTNAIAGLAAGATVTIDYSKNDVFAVGKICYKMAMADNDAEPWPSEMPDRDRAAGNMVRIPEGKYSPGLKRASSSRAHSHTFNLTDAWHRVHRGRPAEPGLRQPHGRGRSRGPSHDS
eukprot:COSAG04_NODE_2193_length_4561_cov_46.389960_5_plen_571_part_00